MTDGELVFRGHRLQIISQHPVSRGLGIVSLDRTQIVNTYVPQLFISKAKGGSACFPFSPFSLFFYVNSILLYSTMCTNYECLANDFCHSDLHTRQLYDFRNQTPSTLVCGWPALSLWSLMLKHSAQNEACMGVLCLYFSSFRIFWNHVMLFIYSYSILN